MSNHPRPTISRRSVFQATGAFALSAMLHRPSTIMLKATERRKQTGTAAFLELMTYVDKRMDELGVPAVGVGVVDVDTRHTCALGVTSVDNPQLADAESMFRAGPLSGLFTGSAIGALIDSGELALDDPVRAYLPSSSLLEKVTVRDLVTHRTGWPGDIPIDLIDGDEALAGYVEAMATTHHTSPPGEYFSYGRSNGILAGHLVAEVAGRPFEAAVRKLTLLPLSMEHSSFLESDIRPLSIVDGHTRRDGKVTPVGPIRTSRVDAPVNGMVTNLNELLHFASFHASASTPPTFLSAAVRELMHRPLETGGSVGPLRVDAVGVNWMIAEFGGTRISMLAGMGRGQSAMMAVVPSERFAVIVLANADYAQDLAIEIAFHALDLFPGLRPPSPRPVTRPAAELEKLAGTFEFPNGNRLRIGRNGPGLRLETDVDGTVAEWMSGSLTFVSPLTAMIATTGSTLFVDFVLDRKGEVSWLRHMGQLAARAG